MSAYNLFFYFIIYAFLGWCLEVAYHAMTVGRFINRGFLNGPVCPIYGVGMAGLVAIFNIFKPNAFVLFLLGLILCSLIELIAGYVLEKLFNTRWWDYTGLPFNIGGYICLKFSILWGLGCVLAVDMIHPVVRWVEHIVPVAIGWIFIGVSLGVMLADTIITANTVLKLNRDLRHLSEIGSAMRRISDEIGENIFEGVEDLKEKAEKAQERADDAKESFAEEREKIKDNIQNRLEEREKIETFAEERERFKDNIQNRIEAREKIETFAEERERFKDNIQNRLEAREKIEAVKAAEAKKRIEGLRKELAAMREEYAKTMEQNMKAGRKRLLAAFPRLRSRIDDDILDKIKEYVAKKRSEL